LQKYGESIYGTRGGPLGPQSWGVTTQKEKKIYVHLFNGPEANIILVPGIIGKVNDARLLGTDTKVKFKQQTEGLIVHTDGITVSGPDTVIVIELK
jgi:alpha-L-fucosidase